MYSMIKMTARARIGLSPLVALSVASLVLVAPAAHPAIPEPDVVIIGELIGAAPAGTLVEGRRGSEPIASFRLGDGAGPRGSFVLRVRLETPQDDEPRTPGTVRLTDSLELFVNDLSVGQSVPVTMRGDLIRVPGIAVDGSFFDGDGDFVPDSIDNCGRVSNPDQQDDPPNGIGDACELSILRPLERTLSEIVEFVGNPADGETGFGNVDHPYSLMLVEVTNAQYAEFLSAVATQSDSDGLYNIQMGTDPRGGIIRNGAVGSRSYIVKPSMGDKPVNFVSWLDAARFSNWVANGQGGPSTTEQGAFDLTVAQPAAAAPSNPTSEWRLPSENEWYKFAYYNPARGEGSYDLYPTGFDIEPLSAVATPLGDVETPGIDVVNYASGASWNGAVGNVTTVGATGAFSALGGADLGGNVAEWLGAPAEEGMRVARGGSWESDRFGLESIALDEDRLLDPLYEGPDVGFRLVPEPGSTASGAAVLLTLALLHGWAGRSGERN